MSDDGWMLDSRLAADTLPIGELDICQVRLFNDRRYAWAVLVPRIADTTELALLPDPVRRQIEDEIAHIVRALAMYPNDVGSLPTKINTGMLGNIVRQLHIHIIARHEGDPAWPGPVWGHSPRVAYLDGEADRLITALKAACASYQ
jgi:diadenosine tetraphosphate (Ap4A) HIT family hydrolase